MDFNKRTLLGFVLLFVTFVLLIFYNNGGLGTEGGLASLFVLGFFVGGHLVVWGVIFPNVDLRVPVGTFAAGSGGILLYPPFGEYPGEYGIFMLLGATLLASGILLLGWCRYDRQRLLRRAALAWDDTATGFRRLEEPDEYRQHGGL